ncbi:AMP-binding protein [Streptomyces ipomoeae]|nr:AMP-binding protein [Streptomyces ipomoeae]MDX2698829.1 AMP-binding protein [Streptomyces ipomoeae]MDX2844658.1 AMP-binding protein [Streptomyces ipomoeae]TQE20211.1 fatty acyl-AMP ligase [Streptomyces ipomoeae]
MTLFAALGHVAARRSGRGMHVLHRGRDGDALSYTDLFTEAGRVAAGLLSRGVQPGERVALVLPTSVDFARAFFGVLAAGAVAVPLPGPAPFGSSDAYLRRTAAALHRSRVRVVLTAPAMLPLLGPGLSTGTHPVDVLLVPEVAEPGTAHVARTASDQAVVQYTSGTSSEPRGVVLTHGNVAASVEAIARGTRLTGSDVGCTWLPLFHDMGLVGSFLTPLLHDVDTHLLTPEDYLRDPRGWIEAIGRLGATYTMAPDSGYRYVLRRDARPLTGLDLSRWRIAVNGAEPVDRRLQDAFVERFAPAGLAKNVFLPAYGLAEATLAVAFPPVGRPTKVLRADRDELNRGRYVPVSPGAGPYRELVGVGTPVWRTEVRLTTASGGPAADGTVGAIEVRGASVSSTGYDHHPEESRRLLLPGGWVATGDLGLWHDGELYIVGRTKEVIIVFGANHWASDIEAVVRDTPGLPVHGVLAEQIWSDEGGRLGLVVETTQQDEVGRRATTQRIRARVVAELGITPDAIVFVRRGGIARTSSGKALRRPPPPGMRTSRSGV